MMDFKKMLSHGEDESGDMDSLDIKEKLLTELIDKLAELTPLLQEEQGASESGEMDEMGKPKAKIEMMSIDAKPKEKMLEDC